MTLHKHNKVDKGRNLNHCFAVFMIFIASRLLYKETASHTLSTYILNMVLGINWYSDNKKMENIHHSINMDQAKTLTLFVL